MAETIHEINAFSKVTDARWYPRYHLAPPYGWCNDPNGFCFYKGQYHFFYQYHPYDAQWGPMHWGHLVSDDLAYWKHLPIALKPDRPYDEGGCFTGSAIEKDGKLYLMYTGNVPGQPQRQAIAVSNDGLNFEKSDLNPILEVPQDDEIHGGDFRDPKVWEHDGKYYAVIGSKTRDDLHGQALLFESEDLFHWDFKSIMARDEGNEGKMWECPNFAHVDGCDVLIYSPMDMDIDGRIVYHDKHSAAFVGTLDYETGIFDRGELQLLDRGFDMYAPQVTETPDGRTIMIGWLDMWAVEMPEATDGWAGMMSIPRELHVRDGKIFSTPVKELEQLRLRTWKPVLLKDVSIDAATQFEGVEGEACELVMTIDAAASKKFSIAVRASETEQTVMTFDGASSTFTLDRSKSGRLIHEIDFKNGDIIKPADNVREIKLEPCDKLKLHVFIDRSSLEVFINDGAEVLSTRLYPTRTSQSIIFTPLDEIIVFDELNCYKLDFGLPHPHIPNTRVDKNTALDEVLSTTK
ncbi:MAG: glycoside hydrolase family 32 protein [Selenomonadaceae bacterium]|nr:glycoside hydrolase family 32 protein [Selenomonadaceae bacterium]